MLNSNGPLRGGKQAVRKGNWKAVRLNVRQNPDASVELYNLEDDLGEQRNVSAQHPEIVEQMITYMKEAHIPNELFPLFE